MRRSQHMSQQQAMPLPMPSPPASSFPRSVQPTAPRRRLLLHGEDPEALRQAAHPTGSLPTSPTGAMEAKNFETLLTQVNEIHRTVVGGGHSAHKRGRDLSPPRHQPSAEDSITQTDISPVRHAWTQTRVEESTAATLLPIISSDEPHALSYEELSEMVELAVLTAELRKYIPYRHLLHQN